MRISQMALALDIGVSSKHLSFVETRRANPSRGLVIRLADALDLRPRERNELLELAGFAPLYRETSLAAPDMEHACRALALILASVDPFGAVAFDRDWNVVMANRAYMAWVEGLWPAGIQPLALIEGTRINLVDLFFESRIMRQRIRNWEAVAAGVIDRVRRDIRHRSPKDVASLASSLEIYAASVPDLPQWRDPFLPMELRFDGEIARMVNTICVLGTAMDLSLQDIRIEMFHPADEKSRDLVESWAQRLEQDDSGYYSRNQTSWTPDASNTPPSPHNRTR